LWDQLDNRQIIRDMLAPTDYEITETENGEEALAAIHVHFTAVAKEMMRRYPDYGLPIFLWLTHGPGFGTARAKGVPAELLSG
jgi:hypothetical protein